MTSRTVEVASGPTRLRLANDQLQIFKEAAMVASVPLEDLGLLVVAHPAISFSASLMNRLLQKNVAVLLCGEDYHPSGHLVPIAVHSTQAETVWAQAGMKAPLRQRIWAEIVRVKIRNQGDLLKSLQRDVEFGPLLRRIRSGDPQNIEAQAARRYWRSLFGNDFRRNRDGGGLNAMLNYGYAIVRSATARAVCGAGLNPTLGLHHSNRYNPFGLVDDLVEPLRPLVDQTVHALWDAGESELSREARAALLEVSVAEVGVAGVSLELPAALERVAASLRRVVMGEQKTPVLPRVISVGVR